MPRVIVTDKLRSYGAAHREVMPSVEHRSHKGLNNRAENSHQPTRQRERAMKGFRSVGGAQRFLSAFSGISPHFRPRRHLMHRTRLPSRDDRPLRHLGPDHRRRRPPHHGLSTGPEPGSTTPRRAIRHLPTQQRDSAAACPHPVPGRPVSRSTARPIWRRRGHGPTGPASGSCPIVIAQRDRRRRGSGGAHVPPPRTRHPWAEVTYCRAAQLPHRSGAEAERQSAMSTLRAVSGCRARHGVPSLTRCGKTGIESVPRKRFDGMLRPVACGVNGVPQGEGGPHAGVEDRRVGRFGAH